MIDPIEYAWKHCNPTVPFETLLTENWYGELVFASSHLLCPEPWTGPGLTIQPKRDTLVADGDPK
jgi:hypothetical protein